MITDNPLYQAIRACELCKLRKGTKAPVPGVGPMDAKVMFIGEAPGRNEDKSGIPFTGLPGQVFNWLLRECGLDRDEVYVTNTVRCKPANNRTPEPDEVDFCASKWLDLEIQMVKPEIIVTMGAVSSKYILKNPQFNMEKYHGVPQNYGDVLVLPVYHPAAGLHDGQVLRLVRDDFDVLTRILRGAKIDDLVPHDEYPERDYQLLQTSQECKKYLDKYETLALDTETVDGELWSVQLSGKAGEGRFIPASVWKELEPEKPLFDKHIIMHNYLYDASFVPNVPNFMDTMVMAYLTGYPQGLKVLAYRLCGIEMDDYEDMVKPHRRKKALDYLTRASEIEWDNPEPYEVTEWNNKKGKLVTRLKKPKHIKHKIADRIKKANEDDEYDPFVAWFEVDERERKQVEDRLGVIKDGSIADADFNTSFFYSCQDADATIRVYQELNNRILDAGLSDVLLGIDLPTLPIVLSMMQNGIMIDSEHLANISKQCHAGMLYHSWKVAEIGGMNINPNSDQQVSKLVYGKLGFKATRYTQTGRESTLEKELKKVDHPVIRPILDYRHNLKIKSTYADPLPKQARDGRIHTTFTTTRTETGRPASKDPNIQNIPVRTKLGKEIKKAFVAPEGRLLIAPDYSQIELRVLAHLAQCKGMIDVFRRGDDIHTATASEMYGLPIDRVSSDQRRWAKILNFGIDYGMSAVGFHDNILAIVTEEGGEPWPMDRCTEFINLWFQKYWEIRDWQMETVAFARRNGYVQTMFGRRRHMPQLQVPIKSVQAEGERMAINMPVQGTAADILKIALRELFKDWESGMFPSLLFVSQVHDEAIEEIDDREWYDVAVWNKRVMESVVKLSVPVLAEVKIGKSWGNMIELEGLKV